MSGIPYQVLWEKCWQVFQGTSTEENVTTASHRVAMPAYPKPVLMDNFPENSTACLCNLRSKPLAGISVCNAIAE